MNEEALCMVEEKIIQKLMKGISFPGLDSTFDINISDEEGRTLLHVACQMGMEKLVNILLQEGAQINLKDCFGRTPIMLACYTGHENIVDILIYHNADIKCYDLYGFNMLTLAVYGGCKMVKYLFNKSITNESKNNNYLGHMPLLAITCSIGNEDLVNFIMSQEPEQVNIAIEKSGMTPLMLAICGGYVKIAKQLTNAGGSYKITSKASFSSICYALKVSFPVLELKIPELSFDEPNKLSPDQLPKHPLTPNLYLSPAKSGLSPKICLNWFKKSMRVKRSKSVDNKKKYIIHDNRGKDDLNTLKSIFQMAKLQQYWPIFKEQQISFRTFLTMDEEDLHCIGINKSPVRNKLLALIEHYNHIFYL